MPDSPFQEEPCNRGSGSNGQEIGDPETGNVLDIDGRDAGRDHQVKEQAGDPAQQIVVPVFVPHQAFCLAEIQHFAGQHRQRRSHNKIESPQQRVDGIRNARRGGRDQGSQSPDQEVCHQINTENQNRLYGKPVNGVGDRYLVRRLKHADIVLFMCFFFQTSGSRHRFPGPSSQNPDTDGAGAKVTRCGNRHAVASSAGKTHAFISRADIVRLSGALTETHGQQQAGSLKNPRHKRRQDHGDRKSGHSLNQIGADDDRPGLEARNAPFPLSVLPDRAERFPERHGNKAHGNRMVNQCLQNLRIQVDQARFPGDQQQETCKHRCGHHSPADEPKAVSQHQGHSQRQGYNAQRNNQFPESMIGSGVIHDYISFFAGSSVSFPIRRQKSRYFRRQIASGARSS